MMPTNPAPPLEPAEALFRLTEAQALSLEVINELLAVTPESLDGAIDAALARLGTFCGSDRTYIFQQTGSESMDNTHEWCAPGIDPMMSMLQGVPMELAQPWWCAFEREGQVYIADVLDLPPGDPLRHALEVQGIRSLLAVPLREDGRLVGLMGYDSVDHVRSFLQGELYLLKSVANIISTLLTRRRIEAEMAEARRRQDLERARMRATLSALPDVVLEVDAELCVIAMHASERVKQPVPPERLVGLSLAQVFPPHVLALAREIQNALERDGIVQNRRCHVELDGRQMWYTISAARRPPETPEGQPSYVVVIRDVTERRAQLAEIERLARSCAIRPTL